ncbi:MAG: CocE/NonD family hydrolase [Acidimicrobiales bacterium]
MRRQGPLLVAAVGVLCAGLLTTAIRVGPVADVSRSATTIDTAPGPPTAIPAATTAPHAVPASTPASNATAVAAAGWRPDEASYGVGVTEDVPVQMPDGRVLRATIHVPTNPSTGSPAAGPFPVILSLTPYGKSVSNPISDYLVQRGYIGVAVDVAGTGGSDGASQLFGPTEAADSKVVISWVAALPQSSGKVGMTGGSYLAIAQLFAAASVGPDSPLKAIVPVAASVDPYRDLFTSGGIVNVESPLGLIASYAGVRTLTPLAERGPHDPLDALRLMVEHGLQAVPFEGRTLLDTILDGDRRFDGAYWQERAPGRVLADIVRNDVAVFLVGGLYDVFQRGEPLLYSGLQNAFAGRPVSAPMDPGQPVSGKYQLLFGPWDHGNQGEGAALNEIELRWFDEWLKGRDTGIADTDQPIQIIEPGGRAYRASHYPLAQSVVTRLHLAPGGRLTPAAPGTDGGRDQVIFTGGSNPCSRSTQQWSAGVIPDDLCGNERWIPGPMPGEVAYTTDPLTTPLTIAGPIGLRLRARATTTDTMWTVTLDDVAPDGTSVELTAGAQLGSLRALDVGRSWRGGPGGYLLPYHPTTRESQRAVVPGEVTRYDIEIRPLFTTLEPGHRLRVTIGTGDFPHLLPPFQAFPELVGGIYDVEHNQAALSWLDLPVIP